jgi:hypothetical protein
MTDSSFIPIDHFDTVFTPRDKKGRDFYKLASTNPGQFMYNIRITNTGTVTAESLEIAYTIDTDFILKGADPIQVWTGYGKTGERIYNVTITDGTITINAPLAPGETIWITFHLEYGPAREIWSADPTWLTGRHFMNQTSSARTALLMQKAIVQPHAAPAQNFQTQQ